MATMQIIAQQTKSTQLLHPFSNPSNPQRVYLQYSPSYREIHLGHWGFPFARFSCLTSSSRLSPDTADLTEGPGIRDYK